jgi:hypothetical protein
MRSVQDCAYLENQCSRMHVFAEKGLSLASRHGSASQCRPESCVHPQWKGRVANAGARAFAELVVGCATSRRGHDGAVAAPLSFGAFWLVAQVAADSSSADGSGAASHARRSPTAIVVQMELLYLDERERLLPDDPDDGTTRSGSRSPGVAQSGGDPERRRGCPEQLRRSGRAAQRWASLA